MPLPFWAIVAIWVATTAISLLLAGRAKKPKPGEIQPPEWESGSPIPVLFGTRAVEGKIAWWGGYKAAEIAKYTLGIRSVIGHRYFVHMALLYCWGGAQALRDIISQTGHRFSDLGQQRRSTTSGLTVSYEGLPPASSHGRYLSWSPGGGPVLVDQFTFKWPLSPYDDGSIDVDMYAPVLYGGNPPNGEGGVTGRLHLYPGSSRHAVDATFADKLASETLEDPRSNVAYSLDGLAPSWDGLVYGVWKSLPPETLGFYVGNSPYPRALALELIRLPRGSSASPHPAMNGLDAPVPVVLHDLFVNDQWGMGVDAALVKIENNWDFEPNPVLVSLLWDQTQPASDLIAELERHDNGKVYEDPETGEIRYKPIRDDYVKAALLHVAPGAGLVDIEHKQGSWGDTVNEIVVQFPDRTLQYKQNEVREQNLAHRRQLGRTVTATVRYEGICDAQVARRVALRDLRSRSVPLGTGRLTTDRRGWRLHPGAAFRLTAPEAGVDDVVMRVLTIDRGSLDDNRITVEYVEDYFTMTAAALVLPGASTPTIPAPPPPTGAPEITAVKSQTETDGTVTLIVVDLSAVVTEVAFRTREGYGEWSAFAADTDQPYQATVPLNAFYPSAIEYRVTWEIDGEVFTDSGLVEFGVTDSGEEGPGGPGGGDCEHVRGTVVYNTGLIGPGVRHLGVVALGKGGVAYRIATNAKPAHIVLYATAAARTADAGRNPSIETAESYEDPAPESGVLLDVVLPFAGGYSIDTLFPPWLYNGDDPASTNIYLAARQLTDGSESLSITFTRVGIES